MTEPSIFRNILKLRKVPRFMRGLLFKRIIFVFQMGKVGSKSAFHAIQESLEEQGKGKGPLHAKEIGNTILLHVHRVSDAGGRLGPMISWRVRLGWPLTVICPIREPIARDISAFFYFYYQEAPDLLENTNLGELEELFLADSRPIRVNQNPRWIDLTEHWFTLNWFDEHFKPLTHIDVYKKPFPIDRKWQIYKRGSIRVLLYRVDLTPSEQTKLVSDFLGIKLDEFGPENDARSRDYAKLYSQFCESVKLPEQYISRMHDSRFAKHFWSPQELKTAADKWRGASGS